jgi:hypothetical protein
VFVSLCYLVLRWLLQFVAVRVRSHEWKELEIIVLRHELAILRRRTRRPAITALTALSLPLRADCCLGRAGRPSSLHLRRCFGGIDAWSRSGGPTRIRWVGRPCGVRSARWCCVSRERIRSGVTNGLSAK